MTLILALLGCSGPTPTDAPTDAPTAVCEDVVWFDVDDLGETRRYYGDFEVEGGSMRFQLDTGSAISFLFTDGDAPAYEPDLAELALPCGSFGIDGRNLGFTLTDERGRPLDGLLGMDFLARGVRFDPLTGEVRAMARPDNGVALPYDDVQGHAIVPVTLDGTQVRLMFDTGGETLWLGQQGQPGDRAEQVIDAEGTLLDVYVGQAELSAAALPPRSVRLVRAPSFPYLETTVELLGGDIHGLLGPEAFAGEQLFVDGNAIVVLDP